MNNPYEEKIREINVDLCAFILNHIDMDKMPDFRPQETIRHMKKEPQNNWRLLYEELQAINENKEHLEILSYINEGNVNRILLYADDKETVEEFVFCYPALTWLLLKISTDDSMVALLLPHGIFLSYIEMKKEYIGYLRSLKITRELYQKHPTGGC